MINIDKIKERQLKEIKEMEEKNKILESLPSDLSFEPTISNIDSLPHGLKSVLSFHSYRMDEIKAIDIIDCFIGAGWIIKECSLSWYDNYAPSVDPMPADELPKVKKWPNSKIEYNLKKSIDIGSVWLKIDPHRYGGKGEMKFFILSPKGDSFEVHVEVLTRFRVSAQLNEYRGGWSYISGTGRVCVPDEFNHMIEHKNAPIYTSQSLRGNVYFKKDCSNTEIIQAI